MEGATQTDRRTNAPIPSRPPRSESETRQQPAQRRRAKSAYRIRDAADLLTSEIGFHRAIAHLMARGGIHAAAILDVDRFRAMRNLHGPKVTDGLLRILRKRLTAAAETCRGKVMRLGMDEFIIVVPATACEPSILEWADRVMNEASLPFSQSGTIFTFTVSMGLTLSVPDCSAAKQVLRCARQAVTYAKQSGGGLKTCSASQLAEAMERGELTRDLPAAIANGQIIPFYQPIVSLDRQNITGLEVLARWLHPRHGLLEPAAFIHVVEDRGLCTALTRALLDKVRADAREWPEHWSFAFNTSPNELKAVLELIDVAPGGAEYMLSPHRLEFEVTENALMRDLELSRRAVSVMQPYGVKVVLDDFGAGFSNFKQLRQVPFSRLKIDKSFITDMMQDVRVEACTQSIIDLAHKLGMTATAEGVEDADLAQRLVEMGCDHAQGFYFGRPMPAAEITALIQTVSPPGGGDRLCHAA